MGKRDPSKPKTYTAKEKLFIQGTNDSSIVSKLSAEGLYPPTKGKPSFFKPFIADEQVRRRSPIINRGYWLRMQCVEYAVRSFLTENPKSTAKKVVVNLGCGFDPLPFQFLSEGLRENVLFIDIDYPDLISIKARGVAVDPTLSPLIHNIQISNAAEKGTSQVCLRSDEYLAVGCDLEELTWLHKFLETEGLLDVDILFTAEVSVTYMRTEPANALISWAASLPNARFSLLEQIIPDGPNNAFARTMLKHFHTLRTPLQSVRKYPTIQDQVHRFTTAGWRNAQAANMLGFWSNLIDEARKRAIWDCEPFDEWEEFFIYTQHYCLLYASNSGKHDLLDVQKSKGGEIYSSFQKEHSESVLPASNSLHVKACGPFRRRFGAVERLNDNSIIYHGGLGSGGRDRQHTTISPSGAITLSPTIHGQMAARMCHTINKISNNQLVLFGGRVAPNMPLGDTWIYSASENEWKLWEYSGQQLGLSTDRKCSPPPRFRHCAVSDEKSGHVLVYGGVGAENEVLNDWWIFSPEEGWTEIFISHPLQQENQNQNQNSLTPRFAASICALSPNTALISGGISADGTVLSEIWRIHWDPSLKIVSATLLKTPKQHTRLLHRFGAQLVPTSTANEVLLIGGVSGGSAMRNHESVVALVIAENLVLVKDYLGFDTPNPPMLIGFSAANVGGGAVMVAGGGAVCFGFGSEWNEEVLLVGRQMEALEKVYLDANVDSEARGSTDSTSI
ncbi:S-adenosyl-L-methionine-dependent methyltransferase [Peziza echinospora]|nr:S-adenosyl-L-methionine-dependent methyltransferase [Peziza echinospora]